MRSAKGRFTAHAALTFVRLMPWVLVTALLPMVTRADGERRAVGNGGRAENNTVQRQYQRRN